MKFSIVILVLATIIYGYHCAPYLDPINNLPEFLRYMQKSTVEYRPKSMKQQQGQIDEHPYVISDHSNDYYLNGVHIYQKTEDRAVNNVRQRTEITYVYDTDKTTIKVSECGFHPDSLCVLKKTEVKDGKPENMPPDY